MRDETYLFCLCSFALLYYRVITVSFHSFCFWPVVLIGLSPLILLRCGTGTLVARVITLLTCFGIPSIIIVLVFSVCLWLIERKDCFSLFYCVEVACAWTLAVWIGSIDGAYGLGLEMVSVPELLQPCRCLGPFSLEFLIGFSNCLVAA